MEHIDLLIQRFSLFMFCELTEIYSGDLDTGN